MVSTGLALADTLILQTGQRGQHVNGRRDALAVQLTAQDDLSLGDITGQVGDGVGLIILGHGEDGNQGDTAVFALLPSGTLIERSKVSVHITGISAAAGHFLSGGGDFTQCIGVVGNIGEDDQHVHIFFKGQILGGG